MTAPAHWRDSVATDPNSQFLRQVAEILKTDLTGGDGGDPGDYLAVSGTSFASPAAAAVAALILSVDSTLSPSEVEDIIRCTATDLGDPGFDERYGHGMVNAFAAVQAASTFTVDSDGDGVTDVCDNCSADANAMQTDSDGDGIGDICDACPTDQFNDIDSDGWCADVDNCPQVANPGQEDINANGVGDICECLEPLYTFISEFVGTEFGWSARPAGDVNNDGVEDIIVGAYNYGSVSSGRVYIYSGADGSELWRFSGGSEDRLGWSVSAAGDMDNDGFGDVIVGAVSWGGASFRGRAYVYSGQTGAILHTFTGDAVFANLGGSVAGISDVNADSVGDLIISSIGFFGSSGKVEVYSGQTFALLYTVSDGTSLQRYGRAVSAAGDVNNDGIEDFVVGAPRNNDIGAEAGRAYAYSGVDGTLLYTFAGEAAGDRFGSAVASAGDFDNDGFADLLIGAPLSDAGGSNSGKVYVYSGQTGDTLWTFAGELAGDEFGHSVSSAGDQNTNGVADLLIGAPGADYGGINAGRVYLLDGLTKELLRAYDGSEIDGRLGTDVSGGADLKNDGTLDLISGQAGAIPISPPMGYEALSQAGAGGVSVYLLGDADSDSVQVACDNCPDSANFLQIDSDNDGIGDVCDICPDDPTNTCCCFLPGDADDGGDVNIGDVTWIVKYIFQSGAAPPCCDQADTDGGGDVNIGDATWTVKFIFQSGDAPVCPNPGQLVCL